MAMTTGLRRLCSAGSKAAMDPLVSVCVFVGEDGATVLLQNTHAPSDWDGDAGHPAWKDIKKRARACGLDVGDTEHVEFFPTGPLERQIVEFIKLPPHTAALFDFGRGSRSPTLSLSHSHSPLEPIPSPAKRAASAPRGDPPPLAKRRSVSTTYSGTTLSSINGTWPLPHDSLDSASEDSLAGDWTEDARDAKRPRV